MNRQQRRADARRHTRGTFQLFLTAEDARIVEEALASYRHMMRENVGEADFDDRQQSAYRSADRLGGQLQAMIHGYGYSTVPRS